MNVKITVTFDYPAKEFREWMEPYLEDGQSEQEAAENAIFTMINEIGLYDVIDLGGEPEYTVEYTPEVYA